MTDETEKKPEVSKQMAGAFVYVEDKKRPTLLELNTRARGLSAERRAEMDTARETVVKAVDQAFGKNRGAKPIVPKASGRGNELRAEAAKAAKDK